MDKIENSTEKRPWEFIKGIHVHRMGFVMILAASILYALLAATTLRASTALFSTYEAMEDLMVCMWSGNLLADGSDYLTEQARLYAVTVDEMYLDHYFEEIREERRREGALELLEEYNPNNDSYDFLKSALDSSNDLVFREMYALRLILTADNTEEALFPPEIQNIVLEPEDSSLSPDAMKQKAIDMIYGREYQEIKEEIRLQIDFYLGSIQDAIRARMEKNHSSMLTIMGEHQIMVLILFAATVIAFLFVIFLLVRPLRRFVICIREGKPLEVRGAYECRSLAYTYNAMCEQNIVNENRLRYQAEHDALTGLLNRGAFDRLQQFLKTKSGSLGLLIIDVDKFKQVNDGYGHEMGDKVLKKVAEFLKESFRSTDYPARIGGDEFAVILSDVTPEQKNIIAEKIREMNRLLTHPSDDLPVVSLSVGGAFSDNGFSDQLYKKADLALYNVKEHGRCGCRFYEEKGDGE